MLKKRIHRKRQKSKHDLADDAVRDLSPKNWLASTDLR